MITKETCIWCSIQYDWCSECEQQLKEKYPDEKPDKFGHLNSKRACEFRKEFREKRKQDCVEIDPRIEDGFYLCKKHLGELKEEILNLEDELNGL